jgi:hypothetical protein
MTPIPGTRGSYDITRIHRRMTLPPIGFTVVGVDGNLCYAAYDDMPNDPKPFIWRFQYRGDFAPILNTTHDWPGKSEPDETPTGKGE